MVLSKHVDTFACPNCKLNINCVHREGTSEESLDEITCRLQITSHSL